MTALPNPARLCLGSGLLGLALIVLNQLSADTLSPALERAAILASLMAVALMLVAVLWSRAAPLAPARVELAGEQGLELQAGLPDTLAEELAWGSHMLLVATPAASVLIHWHGQTLLRRGVLGPGGFRPGPICERACETGKAISLVNLRLYPGRGEFAGLPEGTPAVLVQPIGPGGWLLLGGWSPRCFSRSDELWAEGWSRRLRRSLEPAGEVDPREEEPSAATAPDPPES